MFRVEERDRVQRQLLARAGADGGLAVPQEVQVVLARRGTGR